MAAKNKYSNEVGVLHGHIEALLKEGVLVVDVRSWANVGLCSRAMVYALHSLGLESLLCRVEYDRSSQALSPRLIECFWSIRHISLVLVEARSRHLKLETLSIEDLIVIESRRGGIEANSATRGHLQIACSSLSMLPLVQCLQAGNLILGTKDRIFVVDMLSLLALGDDFGATTSLRLEDANARVLS